MRPVDVRIREKLSDLKERLRETQNNQKRITEELEEKQEVEVTIRADHKSNKTTASPIG